MLSLSDLLSLLLLLGFPELLSGAWYDNCTVNVTEVPDLPKQTRNNNNNNKNNNNNNHEATGLDQPIQPAAVQMTAEPQASRAATVQSSKGNQSCKKQIISKECLSKRRKIHATIHWSFAEL
jgi:hypothetical protein